MQLKLKFLVSFITIINTSTTFMYHTEIIEYSQPGSINVAVNSSVQFSCTGVGDDIQYHINGTSANSFNKGFKQDINIEHLVGDMIRKNLTLISATADLNNTLIQCRVEVIGTLTDPSNFTYSNTTLRIQGTLLM